MEKRQILINSGYLKMRLNGHKKIELHLKKAIGNIPLPQEIEITVEGKNTITEENFKQIDISFLDFQDGVKLLETCDYIEKLFVEIEGKIHDLTRQLYKYAN